MLWTYVVNDVNEDEIAGTLLFRKRIAKTSQKEFRFEKVIKRKGSKLYDKWKKVTICWIDKKYLV